MACVVLVGGIPGSGKSAIINNLIKSKSWLFDDLRSGNVSGSAGVLMHSVGDMSTASRNTCSVVTVSYDEILTVSEQEELVGIPNGWKDFRKDFLDSVEHFICFLLSLKFELSDVSARTKFIFNHLKKKYCSNNTVGSHVILFVEDNFYYSSMRYKWFQVCRKYKVGFCQVFLTCPVEIACKRNNARVIKVPENVIQTILQKLEPPDVEKNQWEKFSFSYSSTKECKALPVKEIAELIKAASKNPPEPVVDISEHEREAQMLCSQNVIHQADRILRRLTGQVIVQLLTNNRTKENLKILTSKINQARQKLLKDLSEGIVCPPQSITEAVRSCESEEMTSEAEKHLSVLLQNEIDKMFRA